MSYKPDETLLMAYLYDELQGEERERVEVYLSQNPEAVKQLEQLQFVRGMLGKLEDKEVIAPPIVIEEPKVVVWNTTYFKAITSIAASLVLLILVGKLTDLQMNYANSELRIGFGNPTKSIQQPAVNNDLTAQQVQQMIDASVKQSNQVLLADWQESQQRMDESIQKALKGNSGKVDKLVQQVSSASEDQIRQYVVAMQAENAKLVKDYMQLTSNEQKQYIEDLLVDFSKYMQQQRTNDLMVLQTRLNNIEQNTDLFKQETEQILTSIIANVDRPANETTKY